MSKVSEAFKKPKPIRAHVLSERLWRTVLCEDGHSSLCEGIIRWRSEPWNRNMLPARCSSCVAYRLRLEGLA